MKKITLNQLDTVEINTDKILQDFDLFAIKVEADFYPNRESLLSVNKSDNEVSKKLIALDYYYSPQDGDKTVYCLCRKNALNYDQLKKTLLKYSNKIFNPKKLSETEMDRVPQNVLLQLFFNQIIDQNVLEGSSLIGKLYLLGNLTSSNNGEVLNINEFSLDNNLVAKISTHCFSQIKIINPDYLEDKLKGRPRFKIDRRTKQIKLAGRGWQNNENQNYYIAVPPIKNGKPKVTKFLRLAARNHYAVFIKSKSGMLYRLLDVFNQQFGQYFSPLAFKEIEVETQQLDKSQSTETRKLKKKIEGFSNEHPITITDIDGDNRDVVDYVTKALKEINIKIVDPSKASLKLAIVHSAEHYASNDLTDPYYPSMDTQHITVENLLFETLNATLYSAVKELIIKNDIKEKHISLLNDRKLPTEFSFFKRFGKDENEKILRFKFLPDDRFEIKELETENFGSDDNPFSDLSDKDKRWVELIIRDETNGHYFKVEKTNKVTLPNVEFYNDMSEFTNHEETPNLSKADLLDATQSLNDPKYNSFIGLIKSDQQDQYSASDVIRMLDEASISSKLRVQLTILLTEKYNFVMLINSRSNWARDRYLNGLTDINYYQDENSIYYNVGVIGKGMNMSIDKGSIVRRISPIDLLNDENGLSSKEIFDLINTMLVTFVKYTNLSVLPFPEKYLNEYYKLLPKNPN